MKTRHAWYLIPLLALSACAAPATLPAPSTTVALRHTDDVRAVLQASADRWRDGVGEALFYADKITVSYERLGVPLNAQHIVLVFHGEAAYQLLADPAYAAHAARAEPAQASHPNPNAELVERLAARGVRVEICASTMQQRGWSEGDLLPGVIVTPNAYPRVIDLQMDGYAHIVFD